MAAQGDLIDVSASTDGVTVTLETTHAGVSVEAPQIAPATPGLVILAVYDHYVAPDGLSVRIPVED